MINKINHTIKWIVVLAIALVCSCSDWLTLEPENNLTRQEYWKNKQQVYAVVGACYATMNDPAFMERIIQWGELRADMMVIGRTIDGNSQNMTIGNNLPTSSISDWAIFYKTINICNTVLTFGKEAQKNDQTFTEGELKAYEAEALTIRSLMYFYLVRSFKEVPLILEATVSDNQNFMIPKSSEPEILTQIIKDLNTALENAPENYGDNIEYNKGRITKSAVNAILADVYLWSNRFDDCIAACERIKATNAYSLADQKNWFNIFAQRNSAESIYELQFDYQKPNTTLNNFFFANNAPRYIGNNVVLGPLFSSTTETDTRGELGSFITNPTPLSGYVTGYSVFKFIGISQDGTLRGSSGFYNNWIFYRYADVLLMEAEAQINKNQVNDAYLLLNQIHQRATGQQLDNPGTQSGLEDLLIVERQKEFAFEGKRWFDLLRIARRNHFARQNLIIDAALTKAKADNEEIIKSNYADTSSYFLPIFQNELNKNNALVQNPYYTKL